jgi:hypothetical protein
MVAMSSASAIPPSHVSSVLLQPNLTTAFSTKEHHPDSEWPALSSPMSTVTTRSTAVTKASMETVAAAAEDWELLHQPETTTLLTTATMSSTVRIVDPAPEQLHSKRGEVIHCRSSPDLRHFVLEDSDDDSSNSDASGSFSPSSCDSSAVLIHNDDVTTASSSVVMVMSPGASASTSTISSPWASKVSFKDTLLKTQQKGEDELHRRHHHRHHHHHHYPHCRGTRKFSPKLVVVQPAMPRSAKSTGDLRSLDDGDDEDHHHHHHSCTIEDDIMGETDAQLYYNQKAQGELGWRNGRKQRPDEAKRLEITMAKKSMQRERTAATSASAKR